MSVLSVELANVVLLRVMAPVYSFWCHIFEDHSIAFLVIARHATNWSTFWRHDTQHNDTMDDDTLHKRLINDTQHNETQHYDTALKANL